MKNSILEGMRQCDTSTQIITVLTVNIVLCSILGAITIIAGLYVVLWGKADDVKGESLAINSSGSKGGVDSDCIGVRVQSQTNLSEPLLSDNGDSNTQAC